ncbi:MAG TPA: hypothetical protein VE959_05425 [Bryobacteraceae bacterium]|nr:hypothetical protein [Bryobacteraceae bacterium]
MRLASGRSDEVDLTLAIAIGQEGQAAGVRRPPRLLLDFLLAVSW